MLMYIKKILKNNRALYSFCSRSWFSIKRSARISKVTILNLPNILSSLTHFKKNVLVIEVPYGGLGDHLFFSHIPRIAKATKGYDKVYISKVSPIRRSEHMDFIWGKNPYVDGFTSMPGQVYRGSQLDQMNILDQVMLFYGLDDGVRFHEPEIYYKPKILDEYVGKVIFDPNFVTKLNDTLTLARVTKYLKDNNIKVDMQFKPRGDCSPLMGCEYYIEDKSFEEFCNIIYSCKEIYSYATGTAVLAAALGKSGNVFFHDEVKKEFLFSKLNKYINLQTGKHD